MNSLCFKSGLCCLEKWPDVHVPVDLHVIQVLNLRDILSDSRQTKHDNDIIIPHDFKSYINCFKYVYIFSFLFFIIRKKESIVGVSL